MLKVRLRKYVSRNTSSILFVSQKQDTEVHMSELYYHIRMHAYTFQYYHLVRPPYTSKASFPKSSECDDN